MLFGNRSFIGYYQNPIPDVNAFLEHTFNNDNFMFDLLMENSYEEDGNIILSESSVVDFIGKFFKAIKDAIVKFIKMIKDFITGAIGKLKSLFSKKKAEVQQKQNETESKEKQGEKKVSTPQVAAAAAAAATVANNAKNSSGTGFSQAARKSSEKNINQSKPSPNPNKNTTKEIKNIDYISYYELCNDFMDAIDHGTIEIDILDILNMKSELNTAKSLYNNQGSSQGTAYMAMSTRTNKQMNDANNQVKRTRRDTSLNTSDGQGNGEGYLFIKNYDNKVELIKDKQERMYPDILLGNISKYPLFNSHFTSHTNGTTFRKEVQDFGSISNEELLKTPYKRSITNSDMSNLHRTFDKEFEDIPKLTNRFNKWKDNIEKTLKTVLKDLDNTEKQLKEEWDLPRKQAKIRYDNYDPNLNTKISSYNKGEDIYKDSDIIKDIRKDSQHVYAPKKPLLNYLNTTKSFINDLLSSISSLANAYPKLVGKGTNHIFGLMMEYYDKFYL